MEIRRAITMAFTTLFLSKVIGSYRLVEINPGIDSVRDLRHKIGLNFKASSERMGPTHLIDPLTDWCFSDQSSQQSNLTCVEHFMLG